MVSEMATLNTNENGRRSWGREYIPHHSEWTMNMVSIPHLSIFFNNNEPSIAKKANLRFVLVGVPTIVWLQYRLIITQVMWIFSDLEGIAAPTLPNHKYIIGPKFNPQLA